MINRMHEGASNIHTVVVGVIDRSVDLIRVGFASHGFASHQLVCNRTETTENACAHRERYKRLDTAHFMKEIHNQMPWHDIDIRRPFPVWAKSKKCPFERRPQVAMRRSSNHKPTMVLWGANDLFCQSV
eukprot:3173610-Amphidinium_carterae.2